MTLMIVDPPGAGDIMAVAAHPDDIESWCAGTLARAIDGGATVRLLLVTSGDKGTDDPHATAAAIARRREDEAREAARRLGIVEVAFLRQPDGEVEDTRALRGDLVSYIRRWRPAVLFTHDPEHSFPPYLAHRDHRAVGRAALDAVYPLARDPLSFPEHRAEGIEPHAVGQVWLFATTQPDAYVDITAGFDRKIVARLAHESQTKDSDALRQGWRERAVRVGADVGLPMAEVFVILGLD
jgi:LmbE family N-acetylglucosaminyl deacetylase